MLVSCSDKKQEVKIETYVAYKMYTLKNPPFLGNYRGIEIREGSMGSGMCYIPGTDKEFYMITDRGPNVDATENNKGKPTKLFPIPDYSPKIFRVKLEDDSIVILNTITIKSPDGKNVTGVPNPKGLGSTGEDAWSDQKGTNIKPDPWGIDCEGISLGFNNDFWVCEEYGTSVWNVDRTTGKVINRYWPFPSSPNNISIDSVFSARRPNRGFEAIAVTPSGKVFALLQSPLYYPDSLSGRESRIHRILELDPKTNQTRMFTYIHEVTEPNTKDKDWQVGDMVSLNNNEFLVIEHAKLKSGFGNRIYKINIENATPVTSGKYNGKTLEQLNDSSGLSSAGIKPVQKTLYMDLMAICWNGSYTKPEGLAIINDSTIAVTNDNDFSIASPDEDGTVIDIKQPTVIYVITVTGDLKLKNWVPVQPN